MGEQRRLNCSEEVEEMSSEIEKGFETGHAVADMCRIEGKVKLEMCGINSRPERDFVGLYSDWHSMT